MNANTDNNKPRRTLGRLAPKHQHKHPPTHRGTDVVLVCRQDDEFARMYAEQGYTMYWVTYAKEHFARLYVGETTYTFAWDGVLDFRDFEQEALNELPAILRSPINNGVSTVKIGRRIGSGDLGKQVFATLFVPNDVRQFSFADEEQFNLYKQALEKVEEISLIRYDVQLGGRRSRRNIEYAVTALNPKLSPSQSSEMTLMLPKTQEITTALFTWILTHNTAKQKINHRAPFLVQRLASAEESVVRQLAQLCTA